MISPGSPKRVWVGTKKGLYCFTDSLGHLVSLPNGASNLEVNEIAQDKNENLWIGTAQGLYKIPRTALDHPQAPPSNRFITGPPNYGTCYSGPHHRPVGRLG